MVIFLVLIHFFLVGSTFGAVTPTNIPPQPEISQQSKVSSGCLVFLDDSEKVIGPCCRAFLLAVHQAAGPVIVSMNLFKTHTNFTQPETLDLDHVYNFYLDVESEVSLGIWFVI